MGLTLAAIPLLLGPLGGQGFIVRRSGVRWLREDGCLCRPGEVVGFCNIGLKRTTWPRGQPLPFHEEAEDFQAAFATPIGGRLRHAPGSSQGGYADLLQESGVWTPDFAIGTVEPMSGDARGEGDGQLQLLMAAGRRATGLAEDRAGLLTGWHDRSRAWRVEGDGPIGTLLSLGICELLGVIKGDSLAFLEMFEEIAGPAQVVFVPDEALVPNARVVAEQIRRTPAQKTGIAEDLARTLGGGAVTPGPADWIFAGAMLKGLHSSPATDRYDVLARDGLRQAGPPDAILLSLNAEASVVLRHRRLGYTFQCHDYRLNDAGPAFGPWLRANFEPVFRDVADIQADYRTLVDVLRAESPGARILICNAMSTSGLEDLQTYVGFDEPMGESLSGVRCKDLNLMLHDLAREREIAIIDVDAIAAELGGLRAVRDGVHQNGEMQTEVRREILRTLRACGAPGFGPRLS